MPRGWPYQGGRLGSVPPWEYGVAMPAVTVEHLAKSYGETVAVRDVSFEVQQGEVFALLGPNGAGKTTTVEILEGFRHRSGGRVETLGVDPADRATQRWLRTRIGVDPPGAGHRALLLGAPGADAQCRLLPEPAAGRRGDRADRARREGGRPGEAAVGRPAATPRRRARASSGTPSSCSSTSRPPGLDPSGRRETWELITPPRRDGTTVLLTTHYMDEVEALADRVAVLFGQEIVASGTPSSIGGRDVGAVTIRFRLPEGVALEQLPVVGRRRRSDGMGRDPHRGRAARAARPDRLGAGGWPCAARPVRAAGFARGRLSRSDEVGRMSAVSGSDVSVHAPEPVPERGQLPRLSDAGLVARQVGFEQLSFWLNPIGALMTIAFSVVFLILLGATAGKSTVSSYGGIKLIEYYVAGFCGYGVMAACFTILAITLVNRRETGLLKRLRLSPLPTWMLHGRLDHQRHDRGGHGRRTAVGGRLARLRRERPGALGALHRDAVGGMVCYSAMGVGMSTLVPNQDAAGPIVSLTFFILVALSGLWFPIAPGSGLATFADFFPIRHLIDALVGVVHRSAGYAVLALARPGRHADLGRRWHRRRPAALELVAASRG